MSHNARSFALRFHGDQKYGVHPYSVHLDAVARHAQPYGKDAVIVAYLHDVVEDTDCVTEEIRAEFGPFVADCVGLLTDAAGDNRKARKARTYARMAGVCGALELALTVKAADRLANVEACVADGRQKLLEVYRSEHSAFRQAAYRPGQCDELWARIDAYLVGGDGETGLPRT